MTREQTAAAILVMQAYVDGKRIQYQKKNEPMECEDPEWDWRHFQYIKAYDEEEPAPFDFRGKNIQWVSNGCPRKVQDIGDGGIMLRANTPSGAEILTWDFLKNSFNHWQWSEDNATWRKFE